MDRVVTTLPEKWEGKRAKHPSFGIRPRMGRRRCPPGTWGWSKGKPSQGRAGKNSEGKREQ